MAHRTSSAKGIAGVLCTTSTLAVPLVLAVAVRHGASSSIKGFYHATAPGMAALSVRRFHHEPAERPALAPVCSRNEFRSSRICIKKWTHNMDHTDLQCEIRHVWLGV